MRITHFSAACGRTQELGCRGRPGAAFPVCPRMPRQATGKVSGKPSSPQDPDHRRLQPQHIPLRLLSLSRTLAPRKQSRSAARFLGSGRAGARRVMQGARPLRSSRRAIGTEKEWSRS
ncbi:unnamed protein product [Coccothraustes coccothraustes]